MVPKRLQRLYKKHELKPDHYFSRLQEEDGQALTQALELIKNQSIGVLAVGSTTFPQRHWDNRALMNQQQPSLGARETYQDIDLLISPHSTCPRVQVIQTVQQALEEAAIYHIIRDHSLAGIRYKTEKGVFRGFLHTDHNQPSIRATIDNVSIDFLFSRQEHAPATKTVLSFERRKNYAFSYLQ